MKKGTPLEFDVDTNTQNDAIFETGDTSTFNSQKPPEKHNFNFSLFAYKKTCFFTFQPKKQQKTQQLTKKPGRGGKEVWEDFLLWGVFLSVGRGTLVLRVPEDLPLDLVVPWWNFWVKPWGVWGWTPSYCRQKRLEGPKHLVFSAVI